MKLVAVSFFLCLLIVGAVAAAPAPEVHHSLVDTIVDYFGGLFQQAPTGTPDATVITCDTQPVIPSGTLWTSKITMENTGTMVWNETSRIRLGAVGDANGDAAKFGPTRMLIESGHDVYPQQTYTFEFYVIGPAPGSYSPTYRMVSDKQYQWFGDTVTIPTQVTQSAITQNPVLGSHIMGWNVPGVMQAGQSQNAVIYVQNTGTMTWNETPASKVRLGGVGDTSGDAYKFGVLRILIPQGLDIRGMRFNQSAGPAGGFESDYHAFNFSMTAPSTPGLYKPHIRMVWEGHEWFGQDLTIPITVRAPPPGINSTFMFWRIPFNTPGEMVAGGTQYGQVIVKNTGTKTWYSDYSNGPENWTWFAYKGPIENYNPQFRVYSGGSFYIPCIREGYPPSPQVMTGDTCIVNLSITAPATPGTYYPVFQMGIERDNPTRFGPELTFPVQVTAPPAPVPVRTLHIIGTPAAGILETLTPATPAATLITTVAPIEIRNVQPLHEMVQPPTASFTVIPLSGTAPLIITCNASGSAAVQGVITSYLWDFGDGTTGSGPTVTHVYNDQGTYTVSLTVTDSTGRTGVTSQQVQVIRMLQTPVKLIIVKPQERFLR
jgi:PKD repeat protein